MHITLSAAFTRVHCTLFILLYSQLPIVDKTLCVCVRPCVRVCFTLIPKDSYVNVCLKLRFKRSLKWVLSIVGLRLNWQAMNLSQCNVLRMHETPCVCACVCACGLVLQTLWGLKLERSLHLYSPMWLLQTEMLDSTEFLYFNSERMKLKRMRFI